MVPATVSREASSRRGTWIKTCRRVCRRGRSAQGSACVHMTGACWSTRTPLAPATRFLRLLLLPRWSREYFLNINCPASGRGSIQKTTERRRRSRSNSRNNSNSSSSSNSRGSRKRPEAPPLSPPVPLTNTWSAVGLEQVWRIKWVEEVQGGRGDLTFYL